MNPEILKNMILNGETNSCLQELYTFVQRYYTRFASDVILISSRHKQVEAERNQGVLPGDDYRLEMNSINRSILQIIDSIEGLTEANFKPKKSDSDVRLKIQELDERFEKSRKRAKAIQSNPSRLREKNDIARELGELFINHSELIGSFYGTTSEGIITGIANRYKRVPEIEGIDFFESVMNNVDGNFTKCCIVNALAEIIYTGQLRIGDDQRIYQMLDTLHPESTTTVEHNITRVNSELDYFLGKILPKS
ncbi:MAG: hypothetical protein AAF598_05515 [Bacteroidota bacterium]